MRRKRFQRGCLKTRKRNGKNYWYAQVDRGRQTQIEGNWTLLEDGPGDGGEMKMVENAHAIHSVQAVSGSKSESHLPINVKDAARFLGVSPQTVYLWVERKQIPHLRVMGRNIRFLKSDLEPFRATFKQEVGYGTTDKA